MPTVKVRIPTALRAYASGRAILEISDSATVLDAIGKLVASEPALAKHLTDEKGALRPFVNVYLNNEDVRALARNGETPLADGDVLVIVPSVAGGA